MPRTFPRATLARQAPILVVAGAFLVSRLLAYAAGVRYDYSPAAYFIQYLDAAWLRADLVQSLVYLHSQPPLFNLILGLLSILASGFEAVAAQILFLGLGLAITFRLFQILAGLGAPRWAAAAGAIAFAISPSALVYENWFFYEYPTVALLVGAAWALLRAGRRPSVLGYGVFFGLLALVSLLRGHFHLVWLIGSAALLVLVGPAPRGVILRAALVPALVVALVYAKNAVIFGSFAPSTWFGVNLSRMTVYLLPEQERLRLAESGELSASSRLWEPFLPPADHLAVVARPAPTGVPVLDEVARPSNPRLANFNHSVYLVASRNYLRDSLWVIFNRPDIYRDGIIGAFGTFGLPPTVQPFFTDDNRSAIAGWERVVNVVVFGFVPRWPDPPADPGNPIQVLAYLLARPGALFAWTFLGLVYYGVRLTISARSPYANRPPERAAIAFMIVTVMYVTVSLSLVMLGDNNRYRLAIDPFLLIFATLLVSAGCGKLVPVGTAAPAADDPKQLGVPEMVPNRPGGLAS